ncbi:Rho GTPase activation protein [Lactarius quietus]|nr:Rho GTPase activation protein [Lactarius quietus]
MSFISVEPQSRGFLKSHSNSLLTQFDKQLEIIADRYLAFFQERRRIEASYIDSLRKLHQKANVVDASIDPRSEPTTTRAAWDEVRGDLEREANTQQAFVEILDNDVIKPLTTLKETEDQTRKRVEEVLQDSAANYANHAENTIMKLQQAYLKRYNPRQYAQSPDASQLPGDTPYTRFSGRFSALFRGPQEVLQVPEPVKSEEVFDNECRRAIGLLNMLRSKRVENMEYGYDCLEALVFTPTVKSVLVKYMGGMVTARSKNNELAMSARAEVEKAFAGTDTSNLKASFDHNFSLSIPPLTIYCNYRPDASSDLIFGVPLVNPTISQDNVPKVIRMCIEEVEKRGLDTDKIYSVGSIYDQEVLQLRRRFESERSFSFSSADNIYSVAMLLKLYLWDLPEPLLTLSLADYRNYSQNRARYTENNCFVLRSKICELHPIYRASLEALLRHLRRVASHSGKNTMTVDTLAARFCYTILRGNAVLESHVHVKKLVVEDLIQNAPTLFNERHLLSPSPDMAHTMSALSYDSLMSSESSRSAEAQAVVSTTGHRPGVVGGIPTSIQPPLLASPSDSPEEGVSHQRVYPC